MIRTYIYNSNNDIWIEEEHELLFHDVCAILDINKKKIYIWKGPKSSKYSLEMGIKSLNNLISNFQDYELIILNNNIPIHIREKLDKLLESVKREKNLEKYEFTHFVSIRSYFLLSLITLIIFLIFLINLWSMISWPISYENIVISAEVYQQWLNFSQNLLIIIIIILSLLFILSIYEYEAQAIIISIIGLIISISMLIYLQQGIFLFLFQSGSNSSTYLIKRVDIFFFLILLTSSTMSFVIPSIIKLTFFFKTYKEFIF